MQQGLLEDYKHYKKYIEKKAGQNSYNSTLTEDPLDDEDWQKYLDMAVNNWKKREEKKKRKEVINKQLGPRTKIGDRPRRSVRTNPAL